MSAGVQSGKTLRVWIVNPFDNLPVEGNRPQRYWLMAREFARRGHEVTFWSADFSHARKCRRDFGDYEAEGVRVRLVHAPAYRRNVSLGRVWSHRLLARNWLAAARLEPAPDLVVASLPPLGLAAAAMDHARRVGARFALDVMDAWPETFERLAPAWLFAPLRRVARRLYRGADAVTAVAERYVGLARASGAVAPVRLFHHGIEIPGAVPPPRVRASAERLRLVYAGNMGRSYDLATVVAAVRALDGVELDLAGAGPCERRLRARAAGCPRIRFHGYLDAPALRALLARAHVGVVPMFPDSCVGVPYKLADYLAAGLAVVSSLPGETARILEKYHCGACYEAANVVSFTDSLSRVNALAPSSRDWRGAAAHFDAARIYRDCVDFLEVVCK